ncbi:TYRO protein tyrosine kinase-binding protein, partial [Ophiophagus hannah]
MLKRKNAIWGILKQRVSQPVCLARESPRRLSKESYFSSCSLALQTDVTTAPPVPTPSVLDAHSQQESLQGQQQSLNLGTSNMAQLGFPILPILLGLTWPQLGAAQVANDCGHCYQINPGTIAGVVLGDLFLTLLIALGVYYVVSCIYKQQATNSGKEEGFPRPQCTLSP